jgi:hypothetical protein
VSVRRLSVISALLTVLCFASSLGFAASQGYAVAGALLDSATGQPLAGFRVTLTPDKGGAGQSAYSAANGKFSFASIPVGKYILSGSGPGYRAQGVNQHDNYFTGVAVGPELDATNIVFRMQADASIRGQVIDEQNEPIRNATAQLFRVEEVNGIRRVVSDTNAGTNDQGIYHFSHLSPGTYYIAISARPWYAQYAPQSVRGAQQPQTDADTATRLREESAQLDVAYALTFYPGADDSSQASAITLRPGERFAADLTMRAVPTAHLKIRSDRQANGPGPTIMQRVFDGLLISVFSSTGYGYSTGNYEFGGLAPGRYTLEFSGSAPDKSGGKSGWFRDVDLYGDLEISASESPSMATVTGLISYEGGVPPRQETYLELRNQETGDNWTGKVSDKGLFGLKQNELRPGNYQAILYGPTDWIITRIIGQNAVVKGSQITLAPGAAAKLVCTATRVSASVSGTVLRNDKPLAGAMVLLVPEDGSADKERYRRDESDSDGTFTLRQIVPGRYTAVAIQNGWNIEWGDPEVLKPYLAQGEKITVTPEKNSNLKLQSQ